MVFRLSLLLFLLGTAFAQGVPTIPNNTVMGNTSGGVAAPSPQIFSALPFPTITGSPVSGQIPAFSGATSIGPASASAYSVLGNNTGSSAAPSWLTSGVALQSTSPNPAGIGPGYGMFYSKGTLANTVTESNAYAGNDFVTIDNGAALTGNSATVAINMTFGGSTLTGNRTGGSSQATMNATTGNLSNAGSYAGFNAYFTGSANDNGTGLTPGTASGQGLAQNTICTLQNGATNWYACISNEADVSIQTGASVMYVVGVQAIKLATNAVEGSIYDTAFKVGVQTGMTAGTQWGTGIQLSEPANGPGGWPYTASATIISSPEVGTTTNFIDAHNNTFTGYIFDFNNLTVTGAGVLTAASISNTPISGSTGAFTTATAGPANDATSVNFGTSALGTFPGATPTLYATAVGVGALGGVLTSAAISNSAFGYHALVAVTSGSGNTGVGTNAGAAMVSGSNNTFVGSGAGGAGVTANNNSAVGTNALRADISGAQEVAMGVSALLAATGVSNTALGYAAGAVVTSGTSNTLIGNQVASTVLVSGANNIEIGTSAATTTPAAASSNEVNIGGLLFWNTVSLAAPAVTACGTSPAIDAHANNRSGTVTVGTVSAVSCTVTFAGGGYTTWNHCRVTSQTTLAAFAYSYTKTVLTVTGTSLVGDLFDYDCDGY